MAAKPAKLLSGSTEEHLSMQSLIVVFYGQYSDVTTSRLLWTGPIMPFGKAINQIRLMIYEHLNLLGLKINLASGKRS